MKKIRKQLLILLITLTFAIILCSSTSAADLNLTKGSWDTAGLDSNNVNVGPNETLVQVRVNNNGTTPAANVNGTFAFTSANTYINLVPGENSTKNIGTIQPGETKDLFFLIGITRNSAAYLTSRDYTVSVQGSNTTLYTITGSLYVEKLLSQSRNDVTGLTVSPNNPQVGDNFTATMTSTTGSVNYPDLALPLVDYDPSMVLPLGMVTTYIDANGDPQTTYKTYIPFPNANAFTTVWTFKVLKAGATSLFAVIYDRSGSSYHYNADYGNQSSVDIFVPGSLGDFVWEDINANGIIDPGEPGIPNVLVNLFYQNGTAAAPPTSTNANGYYYFNNLYPGNYYIKFNLASGYVFTPFFGAGYNSTANPVNGSTAIINLSAGVNDYRWDAGMYRNATIGNFVWNDQNANGIYEGIGTGIPNVTVQLYNSTGTLKGTTTTDSNGFYYFYNVAPGAYYVEFTAPAGFNFSPYIVGVTDNKANSSGRTETFTVVSGQSQLQWDAGMYLNAAIGNFVWNDLNANGMIDPGDVGIPGVTVNLYYQNGTFVKNTNTNSSGNYLFNNLRPDSYYVQFIKPSGYIISPYIAGVTNNTANPLNSGKTETITLTSNQTQLQWDAGMYRNATVGDFVFMDVNLDGIYDSSEDSPLDNIVVNLFNGAGVQIDSTSTNSTGNYLFTGLSPGIYYVQFVKPTIAWLFSHNSGPGFNNTANSTGFTTKFDLKSGDIQLQWDAGMLGAERKCTLGDYVWDDQNADGINQGRGLGIPNVTVNLYLEDGTFINSTVTNSAGFYYFNNLEPTIVVQQPYRIHFILPTSYNFSPYIPGVTNNTADPTPGPNFGRTPLITLEINDTQLQWDAGMYKNVTIGDFVWNDLNANGMIDPGDMGIPGVNVRLLYQNETPTGLSDTTDSNGYYLFENLRPGDYILEFIKPSADWIISPYIAGVTENTAIPPNGRTATITLFSGQTQLQWDAGMYREAMLGDYVWNDLNANGMIDSGETGLSGVIVKLYTQGIQIASTTTDLNGYYLFTGLTPGNYYLQFIKPTGFNISPYTRSVTDNKANTTTGLTANTALISGESQLYWDAGMWMPASLGSFVWNDQNANGIFEGRGIGLPNIQVDLYKNSALINSTVTDANGFYSFSNLVPGNYSVKFTLLSGFFFSPQFPVTDPNTTSKANPVSGFTAPLSLSAGENFPYLDAGQWQPVTIGDLVWNDLNRNGIRESGEPGLANVLVRLYDINNNLINSTYTNSIGNYIFQNQRPNFYYTKFILPAEFTFSPQYVGDDSTINSKPLPATGETALREYTSGTVYLDNDAGMYQEQADLAITKTVTPNPANVGDTVTYTIVVRDNGPDTAQNVQVTDVMPSGLQYISHTATIGTYNPATGIWTIGNLTKGTVATLTIMAKATSSGNFVNIAVVNSTTYDPNPDNNRANATLTVNPTAQAAEKTIPLQKTGLPVAYIALAVLMLLAGYVIPKRK